MLYDHQQKILRLNPKKHLLAWQTGTGKTLAAIKLAEQNADIILVICPKSLKQQWEEEIKKYSSIDNFSVMTKEQFRKFAYSLKEADCVIVDEAHYFSGMKSQMSKALLKYIEKVSYIYLLTATPYMSTPWNIYALARILGYNWNYMKFKHYFFNEVSMGGQTIPIMKKNMEKEIAKLVNKLGSTVKLDDCADVPEQTFLTEHFDLTAEQKKAMVNIDDILPIVRFTKEHQICGGTLKGDGYVEDQYFKSEKLNRLIDLCKEHKKIVVVCRYNAEVKMICDKIIEKTDKTPIMLIGETKDKHSLIAEANNAEQCAVVVNAACSEGYELPTFPIMIFYSYDFSLKNYIQMIGRVQRINKIKKNVYISLIVKGAIDEDVYKCIMKKQNFDIEIYSKQYVESRN